jgi:hypothetical protein
MFVIVRAIDSCRAVRKPKLGDRRRADNDCAIADMRRVDAIACAHA